jgi:two-component system response regulator HydG
MAKILVVDDQRNMRTTLAMLLRGAEHHVDEAENGDVACERVAEEAYDLVLTDLKMGATDGIAVLRRTREVSP